MSETEIHELWKTTAMGLRKIIMQQAKIEDTKDYMWLTDNEGRVYLGSRGWFVDHDWKLAYMVNVLNILKYGETSGISVEREEWEATQPVFEAEYY